MTKILLVLVIAFAFEAIGVITLKEGITVIGQRYTERKATLPLWKNILHLVGNWFTNRNVLLGLLFETIFFVMLQYLLGQRDVSFVWPLTSISFVFTTVAAQLFLHEKVDAIRWSGVALIVIGAMLISLGEYNKDKAAAPAPAASATPK